MLRLRGIGAREQQPPTSFVGEARPHLLTIDQPFIAVADCSGGEASEIAAGAGLAEHLAPNVAGCEEGLQEPLSLVLAAMIVDRRGHHSDTEWVEMVPRLGHPPRQEPRPRRPATQQARTAHLRRGGTAPTRAPPRTARRETTSGLPSAGHSAARGPAPLRPSP